MAASVARKGFFISLPSVSVTNTLTGVVEEMACRGYDIVYYNDAAYLPAGNHHFRCRSYPACADGYSASRIDIHTTYFGFGQMLVDTASGYIDYLIGEAIREQPDFILFSHLAPWGKWLAGYLGLPAITLCTTFILDRRIMQPAIRQIPKQTDEGFDNIREALTLQRKLHRLFQRLQLDQEPDIWDIYVNKTELNISFILKAFQPQQAMFGSGYRYAGFPLPVQEEAAPEPLVYIALGTILNTDITFYKRCIQVLKQCGYRAILSVGAKIDIGQLGEIPATVQVVPFVNQVQVLRQAALFITQGGMASVHEAIYTGTPMIVIPEFPEQKITAETIRRSGAGIHLPPEQFSEARLYEAITDIMRHHHRYTRQVRELLAGAPALPAATLAANWMHEYLHETSAALYT